jgi:polyisoprenoid-binding protein YceI
MRGAAFLFALGAAAMMARPAAADCSIPAPCPIAPLIADIPAGDYRLDPAHASIVFHLNRLGFSQYSARFARFDAMLHLDPVHPERAEVFTTIDPNSLELTVAPPGFRDLLLGPQWLNTAKYTAITFQSTRVTMTAPDAARIAGNFSLRGIVKPVVLTATFKGGFRGTPSDPRPRVTFSVRTKFKRSAFGLGFGSPLIAGDEVDVAIDAEFTGPVPAK